METMTLGLVLRIQAALFVMTLSLQLHLKYFICIMLFWIGIVLPILLSAVKGYEQCPFYIIFRVINEFLSTLNFYHSFVCCI